MFFFSSQEEGIENKNKKDDPFTRRKTLPKMVSKVSIVFMFEFYDESSAGLVSNSHISFILGRNPFLKSRNSINIFEKLFAR